MSNLISLLNQGREQVPITRMVDPFDVKMGPIPDVVPMYRDEGKIFAGGKVVLAEKLKALRSGDAQQINAWGNNYFDLADMSLTFEDLLKAQSDSPLLKGIRGVVETSDGLYVAVNAEAVSKATKGKMESFKVRDSEKVTYGLRDNKVSKQVSDVVLLKYTKPIYVEMDGDQFNAIAVEAMKRADFVHGRDLEKNEIVDKRKVVHPVYKALYSAKLVNPLVSETFKFNKERYGYDTNMGIYLASEPQDHAEMRAFCVGRLGSRWWLYGSDDFGGGNGQPVGVVEKGTAGATKK